MPGDVVARAKFTQGWSGGLPETPCGNGSTREQTRAQSRWIPRLVEQYGIHTIADIGAGDLNWVRHVEWPAGVTYTAYDLVPRHPSVKPFDLLEEIPPKVDLLMCLWVLNHLPFDDCRRALANLRASGSRWLLMTDRPRWHHEQPPEIQMPYVDELVLNREKGDRMVLVSLC